MYSTVSSKEVRKWVSIEIMKQFLHNCKIRDQHSSKYRNMTFKEKYNKLQRQFTDTTRLLTNKLPYRKKITKMTKDLNLSKNVSKCSLDSCPGNMSITENQVLCCSCRKWYHISCVNLVNCDFPVYFVCIYCQ